MGHVESRHDRGARRRIRPGRRFGRRPRARGAALAGRLHPSVHPGRCLPQAASAAADRGQGRAAAVPPARRSRRSARRPSGCRSGSRSRPRPPSRSGQPRPRGPAACHAVLPGLSVPVRSSLSITKLTLGWARVLRRRTQAAMLCSARCGCDGRCRRGRSSVARRTRSRASGASTASSPGAAGHPGSPPTPSWVAGEHPVASSGGRVSRPSRRASPHAEGHASGVCAVVERPSRCCRRLAVIPTRVAPGGQPAGTRLRGTDPGRTVGAYGPAAARTGSDS